MADGTEGEVTEKGGVATVRRLQAAAALMYVAGRLEGAAAFVKEAANSLEELGAATGALVEALEVVRQRLEKAAAMSKEEGDRLAAAEEEEAAEDDTE